MSTRLPDEMPAAGDARALLALLVRQDSRNPALVAGGPGEGGVARCLADVLARWGLDVELQEVRAGRPNVVARTPAARAGRGPVLMLNGHLDVVGVEGMIHAPFDAAERDGRLYGRGAADMKGGIAAMCAATVRALRSRPELAVVIAAVIDEEWESEGTRALVERGVRADAAIVTEPTRLAIAPAHRGFAWLTLTVRGRAAHGSRWDIGVDAIRGAALVLAELDRHEREALPARTHPLLGRASLHASLIEGGIGMSTYPDRCVVRIERRTIPGESAETAVREVEDACARVRAARPELDATVALDFAQPPSDVPTDAPIVRALSHAIEATGETPRIEGLSAWTDAAILNEAGIPAICYGPGDIALAHAAEEWIPLDEVRRATEVLEGVMVGWGGGGPGTGDRGPARGTRGQMKGPETG
ncbi:MAG TPA: ArgE/DapE family deacylase [Gemmatimonadaceae bacterium]